MQTVQSAFERVQAQRKPRGRGRPKAVLPTLEEATIPDSAAAFVAWHSLTRELGQAKTVWSKTEVCRQIAKMHGIGSVNTVEPFVRAIHARLTPPKPLDSSLFGQLTMAQKSVK